MVVVVGHCRRGCEWFRWDECVGVLRGCFELRSECHSHSDYHSHSDSHLDSHSD